MKKTFDQWMAEVNTFLNKLCYLSSDDLPDCSYMMWYEDGVRPATAAKRAMKEAW